MAKQAFKVVKVRGKAVTNLDQGQRDGLFYHREKENGVVSRTVIPTVPAWGDEAAAKREHARLYPEGIDRGDRGTDYKVSELWDLLYTKYSRVRKPKTMRGHKTNYDNHIGPEIGDLRISQVTPRKVADLYDAVRAKGKMTGRKLNRKTGKLEGG